MKNYISLVLVLIFWAALPLWSQEKKEFAIVGELTGYEDSISVKLIRNGENTPFVTTKMNKGRFVLQGYLSEPTLVYLIIGEDQPPQPLELFLGNDGVSIRGTKGNPYEWLIQGAHSNDVFRSFLSDFLPYVQLRNNQAAALNEAKEGAERDSLIISYGKTNEILQRVIDGLVDKWPESPVTPFVLAATYGFSNDPLLLEKRYLKLSAENRESAQGKQINSIIQDAKVGAIGSQAIDFAQPDTSGKMVSLSSFRGKYVLVDFWASWCGPCRQENPNVVSNYRRFRSKNFTVLGVSLDREDMRSKWMDAIHKDQLTWTHVSDLKFWNNEAARLYRVTGIPYNMLIDPEGKIIAKNLRGPDLEATLCRVLGCNEP